VGNLLLGVIAWVGSYWLAAASLGSNAPKYLPLLIALFGFAYVIWGCWNLRLEYLLGKRQDASQQNDAAERRDILLADTWRMIDRLSDLLQPVYGQRAIVTMLTEKAKEENDPPALSKISRAPLIQAGTVAEGEFYKSLKNQVYFLFSRLETLGEKRETVTDAMIQRGHVEDIEAVREELRALADAVRQRAS
jgi:hypothetical protein